MSSASVDPTDAVAIAAAVRGGQLSAREVVEVALDRIGDDELAAWVHLDPDLARRHADAVDARGGDAGPLAGVPVGVKDIIDTADQPTRFGSPIYAEHRPERDAAAVARLRGAGAIILGKTVTTEFAVFTPGPTVNPHDRTRTPGGSSSGSAAAVAAGHVPLAVGTQTAGSVVRPASFCGVVGAKPTLGAVPLDGVKLCSSSLDTVGLLGADVASVALGLSVMADAPGPFRSALEPPQRIAFSRTPWWDAVEPSCAAIIADAVDGLADHLDVLEVELPAGFAGLVDVQRTVMNAELVDELGWELAHHPDLLSDTLRRVLHEAYDDVPHRAEALAARDRCRQQLSELFPEHAPVLLVPSVLGEAPPVVSTGDPMLCRPWTLLGTPTVSVPGLRGPAGLPLGVQVVAAPGRDDLALAAASRLAELFAR